jgi:hypothetical protein
MSINEIVKYEPMSVKEDIGPMYKPNVMEYKVDEWKMTMYDMTKGGCMLNGD